MEGGVGVAVLSELLTSAGAGGFVAACCWGIVQLSTEAREWVRLNDERKRNHIK